MEDSYEPMTCANSLKKLPNQQNMEIRFGTWNVKRLYRAGSLVRVMKELSKFRQEVRWVAGHTELAVFHFLSFFFSFWS
jgi:hypothetical protein